MNAIMNALSEHQLLIQTIGWTIIHSLWQGAIVALAAAGILRLRTPGRAEVRYAVACGALVAMALLPFATLLFLRAQTPPVSAGSTTVSATPLATTLAAAPMIASAAEWRSGAQSAMPFVVAIWAAGVALLSLRLLSGLLAIELLTRRTLQLPAPLLLKAKDLAMRLGVSTPVRFARSALIEVPTVAGWLRPMVLVPAAAITGLSPEQLETLLVHELAHIRRHDYLVNLVQSFVETTLFYHPGVWWLSKQIREERENCCDDMVVALCADRLVYARALAELEALRGAPGALALAASGASLRDRILRLVNGRDAVCSQRGRASTAVLVLGIVFLLGPMSIIGRQIAMQNARLEKLASLTTARAAGIVIDVIAGGADDSHTKTPAAAASKADEVSDAMAGATTDTIAGATEEAITDATLDGDLGADNSSAEETNPKNARDREIDRAIKRKMFDLTDEYRDSIARAGYNLDEDGLMEFRIQDVTPEYIAGMNAAGFGKLTAEQLLELKTQDVTPELVREMNSLGLGSLTPEEITQMAMFGVDREFVKRMNALGFGTLSANELIQLAIHGITADDVATARRMFGEATLQDVVALSIHGVTPEFLTGLRDRGYKVDNAQTATQLALHEVTPEFIDSLLAVGVRGLPIEQLVRMRIFDVDADFIRKTRQTGYDDLTIDQMIRLRMAGVEPTDLSRKH